jgi:pectin lyase
VPAAPVYEEARLLTTQKAPIEDASAGGSLLTINDSTAAAACEQYIGRACAVNTLSDSGDFTGTTDSSFLSNFGSVEAASADETSAETIKGSAGVGKI